MKLEKYLNGVRQVSIKELFLVMLKMDYLQLKCCCLKKCVKFFCGSGGEQVFAVTPSGGVYAWGHDNYYQLGVYCKAKEDEKEAKKVEREKKKEEEDKKKEDKEEKKPKGKKEEEKKTKGKKEDKSETSEKSKKKKERKDIHVRPTEAFGIEQLKVEDGDFKIVKICCGAHHTLILDKDGNVYSFGRNNYGQLGLNLDDEVVMEPKKISEIKNVMDISCGANHSLFLTKEGKVYACGIPKDGRFPSNEEKVTKPKLIFEGIDNFQLKGISSGKKHNLIVGSTIKK